MALLYEKWKPYGVGARDSLVVKFERLIGYTLPKDYRRMLLATNGGRPEHLEFTGIVQRRREVQYVESITAVRSNARYGGDLFIQFEMKQRYELDGLPFWSDSIIIGDCHGDNLLLMRLGATHRGYVYFRDDNVLMGAKRPTVVSGTVFLATSFTGFLKQLRPDRDELN